MAKKNDKQTQSRWRRSLKTGLSATGFITAVIVVLVLCFMFKVDLRAIIAFVVVALLLGVGLPLLIHVVRDNNDRNDENETCKPILQSFEKHCSTDKLLADYRAWQQGEHSTYTRVHFGGDVVYALQGAKAYEEALEVLHELETIQGMKARERYDYETYRDQVEPELLEGIEVEKKRAEERARNKNLRK